MLVKSNITLCYVMCHLFIVSLKATEVKLQHKNEELFNVAFM
jgi:hypothetical protein